MKNFLLLAYSNESFTGKRAQARMILGLPKISAVFEEHSSNNNVIRNRDQLLWPASPVIAKVTHIGFHDVKTKSLLFLIELDKSIKIYPPSKHEQGTGVTLMMAPGALVVLKADLEPNQIN